MTTEQENKSTWYDDLMELIKKKQEENQALKKVQKSLQSRGERKDININEGTDEYPVQPEENTDEPNNNENN
jgi:hypothetical protein